MLMPFSNVSKNFRSFLWENILSATTIFSSLPSIILGIFLWSYPPEETISLRIVVVLGISSFIAIITLFRAAKRAFKVAHIKLPKVKQSGKIEFGKEETLYCLLEPSELFPVGEGVSIYYKPKNGPELFIGLGFVSAIHVDKTVQVSLSYLKPYEQTTKISNNDAQIIKELVVKPSVPKIHWGFLCDEKTKKEGGESG